MSSSPPLTPPKRKPFSGNIGSARDRRPILDPGGSEVTVGVSGLLAYHGARFVASEHEFASVAFSGVPAWALESVIPFAFAAIALRYLSHAAGDLRALVSGEDL